MLAGGGVGAEAIGPEPPPVVDPAVPVDHLQSGRRPQAGSISSLSNLWLRSETSEPLVEQSGVDVEHEPADGDGGGDQRM